jgi:uncharacterized damage-inducible protein DinB
MLATSSPATDERDALLAALARQRDALRVLAYGLTDEQARATPRAGGPSVRSLVELATRTERQWIRRVAPERAWLGLRAAWAEHRAAPAESLEELLRAYAGAAVETAELVDQLDDLAAPVDLVDEEVWTVRRVLLQLIEETARLVGHADIVRAGVDGTTFYPPLENTAA